MLFVVLAHEREDTLAAQISNIRLFNPDCAIVLYNSSGNPAYGQRIAGISICPSSRGPLAWGQTGNVLYETIRWLQETKAVYEYLIYIDSDAVFVKSGFEAHLDAAMQYLDCMGVNMHVEYAPTEWTPGQSMWKQWGLWQPLFQTDYLAGMFANGQIYRRELVDRMYDGIDLANLEQLLHSVFALEEMLHATLAVRCGGRCGDYASQAIPFIRFIPPISAEELQNAAATEGVYLVHPVPRDPNDPARIWINRHTEAVAAAVAAANAAAVAVRSPPAQRKRSPGRFRTITRRKSAAAPRIRRTARRRKVIRLIRRAAFIRPIRRAAFVRRTRRAAFVRPIGPAIFLRRRRQQKRIARRRGG